VANCAIPAGSARAARLMSPTRSNVFPL
jgi:hypothetical protein